MEVGVALAGMRIPSMPHDVAPENRELMRKASLTGLAHQFAILWCDVVWHRRDAHAGQRHAHLHLRIVKAIDCEYLVLLDRKSVVYGKKRSVGSRPHTT